MSLDPLEMEIKRRVGTDEEKKYAEKVCRVVMVVVVVVLIVVPLYEIIGFDPHIILCPPPFFFRSAHSSVDIIFSWCVSFDYH